MSNDPLKRPPRIPFAIKAIASIFLVLALSITAIYWRWSYTPPPGALDAAVNKTDESGDLFIESVRMDPVVYENGEGKIEKIYHSPVELQLRNSGDKDLFVAVAYSANAGVVNNYSPGQLIGAEVVRVEAGFEGTKSVDIRHTRFVAGGNIQFQIGTCTGPARSDAQLFLNPSRIDTICTLEHLVVPEDSNGDEQATRSMVMEETIAQPAATYGVVVH